MSEEQRDRDRIVLMAIVVEGGLILAALVLGWLLSQPPLSHFALDEDALLLGTLGTVPMLGLFLALKRWPVGPLAEIDRFTEQVVIPLMRSCTLVDLFGISCLAGLGEEMLFRGVFQDALRAHLPLWPSVLIAAALFGLVHAVTPVYVLLAAAMGVYLGWLYEATGNLLAPVVTHALYDFVVLVVLLRVPADEGEEEPTGDEQTEDEEPE